MKKVLVSEWARRAAHELDDWRSRWLNQRENDTYVFYDAHRINIKDDLNHEEVLSNLEIAQKHRLSVVQDCETLQRYLTSLKSGRLGGAQWEVAGRSVSRENYENHRLTVVGELNYKMQLLRDVNSAIKQLSIKQHKNKTRRDAWKNRSSNREQRISSFNSIFVDVAKDTLPDEIFRIIVQESRLRQEQKEINEFDEGYE